MSELIRSVSCGASKVLKDSHNRPVTHGTSDGLNYLTKGAIPDYNGDLVHLVMGLSTAALFSPKTRTAGLIGWGIIGVCWLVGQKQDAVRPRRPESFCR